MYYLITSLTFSSWTVHMVTSIKCIRLHGFILFSFTSSYLSFVLRLHYTLSFSTYINLVSFLFFAVCYVWLHFYLPLHAFLHNKTSCLHKYYSNINMYRHFHRSPPSSSLPLPPATYFIYILYSFSVCLHEPIAAIFSPLSRSPPHATGN